APPGARRGLVSGDAPPGMEAPAATDVRRYRRAGRPPRQGPDRPGPDRRPPLGSRPAAEGAGGSGARRWRGAIAGRRGAPWRRARVHSSAGGRSADRYPRRVSPALHPGLVVALDGPGSSGKSSVGAAAALELGYRFCDTGLLYRAATWLARRRGVSAEGDPASLVALVPEIELAPDENGRLAHVSVDGVDVTDDVHTPVVDEAVSAGSRVPERRAARLSGAGE